MTSPHNHYALLQAGYQGTLCQLKQKECNFLSWKPENLVCAWFFMKEIP